MSDTLPDVKSYFVELARIRSELERILAQPGLSRDVTEQASKSLLG
jgi:transcription initiation factor TFIIIB Brf1 subunit/transcription initiation factor TFIIB